MKDGKYKNLKQLQNDIHHFLPKDIIDYILNGSQLNRWFNKIKTKNPIIKNDD